MKIKKGTVGYEKLIKLIVFIVALAIVAIAIVKYLLPALGLT